jgi:hypothetical protein
MRRALATALGVLGAACGPSAPGADGDGSSSGEVVEESTSTTDDPASSTSDATTEGPIDVCTPMPVPGVDPFGDDPPCETYYADFEPPVVEVRIVNLGEQAIAVPSPVGPRTSERYFEVSGTMGARHFDAMVSICEYDESRELCVQYSPDPPAFCDLILLDPRPAIVIEPGGAFVHSWSATMVGGAMLPSACYDANVEPVVCDGVVPISAGTFEARVAAAVLADDRDNCVCRPDESGSCESELELCDVTPTLVATATYDGICDRIEIVFDD